MCCFNTGQPWTRAIPPVLQEQEKKKETTLWMPRASLVRPSSSSMLSSVCRRFISARTCPFWVSHSWISCVRGSEWDWKGKGGGKDDESEKEKEEKEERRHLFFCPAVILVGEALTDVGHHQRDEADVVRLGAVHDRQDLQHQRQVLVAQQGLRQQLICAAAKRRKNEKK